jgi:tetratricopeptide (TPR) repeat protein
MAKDKEEEIIVDVEQVYSKSEQWVIENQKVLSIAVGAVIAIIGGYFVLNNFIIAPQEVEAKEYMWQAQQAFAKDSFELAIYGDESTVGFDYIIDEYGMTKAANLAHYYVGVSHLHLGNFEEASEYLGSYSCDDVLVCAVAYGANGDAHLELGEYSDALSLYKRAVDHSDNELTTPIYLKKAGYASELLGDYAGAKSFYERIEKEFPRSQEAGDIQKYIARVDGMSAN